ncbi:MAG: RNA-binding protein [Gammaproteobacteria bacterium]|nr:RNA-binding protein [Gammaproteobacteria bacterium]
MTNNKIYLNNLNKTVTDTLIKEHFAQYGEITDIHLPLDRKTGQPKAYAFVTFADEDSATRALGQDGKSFLDNEIVVQIATEKKSRK